MTGIGRATVPRDSNAWGIFNWLPKKYQQAHNIDLTKLQSYTAEELLELLISVHPDVSYALYTYLRMGDTPLTLTAKKTNGDEDESAQKVLDDLKEMLNTPLASPGYQHGRSLGKLDTIQRMMIMVRGACAGEVVLNEQCNDVIDIVPVDPSLIWFRREPITNRLTPWQFVKNPHRKPGEEWFGNYKKIDTPTFIYEEFDPMVDDPYGRTPMLPVLQVVFFHLQVLADLKAVVHNQGYPRLDISMMEEIMLKNMPKGLNGPDAQQKWLKDRMDETLNHFNSLNPDDALAHWDSVKVEYLKGGSSGPMIDIKKLIDIIDTQMATSLKTLLTILSRHQGSTETYSSIDTQIYIKNVESARSITKRFWQRAFSLSARVRGTQTRVVVDYDPIDLRSENEVEKDRRSKITNYVTAENNFYITPKEAAEEIRWTLGLDSNIPDELIPLLEHKHDPVVEPPSPTPPQGNSRLFKLDNTGGDDHESHVDTFIVNYMMLMGLLMDGLRSAQSIESILPNITITQGIQDRMKQGMWQLYRGSYTEAWNERAMDTGNDRIRYPDTNTSVDLYFKASEVVDGTTNTYHDLMHTKWEKSLLETSGLTGDERLSKVKDDMNEWLNDNANYKSNQIANHEAIIAYQIGMFAHDEINSPETMYEVVPASTLHDECQNIISGGPYTLAEAKSLPLPLHPGCPHHCIAILGGE